MALAISQVLFEHHRIALGINEPAPRISWRFEGDAANWEQSGYDIQIARSGQNAQVFSNDSPDSVLVPWPDVPLGSGEEAPVRVRAHGQDGQPKTTWSDAFTVEPGLLTTDDWQNAVVIASENSTTDGPHQPVLFRKEFSVDQDITSARLYITALGLYEAKINGKRAGDHLMAPGWQSYNNRREYNTYDVTDLVKKGSNAIGVTVGPGWYAGRLGFDGPHYNWYGDTLGVYSLLSITHGDGSTTHVPSDLTWEAGTGPIMTSEIYDGEVYDSRLELKGWTRPGFDTSDWVGTKETSPPDGELVAPDAPPIRAVDHVELADIITTPSGETVLDFGQNLVGWLRLRVSGPAGQTIQFKHVEVLEDGEIATEPLRTAKQTDNFTLSGDGIQVWEPSFTYHGFRYVQVNGWPDETPLDAQAVRAIVVSSDMERTGWLETSNALLNKLHENVRWSMRGNFFGIPTDCPQRDERLGWTGDIHAFTRTANYLFDTAGFLRGWLKDAYSEASEHGGATPVVIPNPNLLTEPSQGVAIWSDAIIGVPWELYQTFGDRKMLKEQYAGAKNWIDNGVVRNDVDLWDRSTFQYGDWLDPLAPPEDAGAATTSAYLVADAYLVHSTELLANMSAQLKMTDQASYYNDWHDKLKTEFQKAWMSPNGTMANETQTGYALPLYFNLFDTPEQYTQAVSKLVNIVRDNDFKIGTGFAGTHLFGHTLTKYDHSAAFYKMILQEEVPSWLYQVLMNGTTTWERWDSMLPNGTLNTGSMTSFNHYAVGSVASWMHSVIGGVSPAVPGYKRVNIEAIPGGGLTSANSRVVTPYGNVTTKWWIDDQGTYHLVVGVPPNSKANVKLPGKSGRKVVGSGIHKFSVP